MAKTELNKLLEIAIQASIKAAGAILEVYNSGTAEITIKSDNSPLTTADLNAHKEIQHFLKQTPYPILSEEGEVLTYEQRSNSEHLWIVDPLDGTKEFINRNGEFTVNIALIRDNAPILGVVLAPVKNELFFASEEIGSFKIILNQSYNISDILQNAIKLPLHNDNNEITIVASRSHLTADTEVYIDSLRKNHPNIKITSRGSSLKFCLVAEGKAQYYPRFAPTMEWDTAAGHAICRFSGIEVIDWETKKDMSYNKKELLNNWFVAKQKTQQDAIQ